MNKCYKKSYYEILFKDSSEYFAVHNAKMIQEGLMVRFVCFDSKEEFANYKEDIYYPIANIYRIKKYL